MQFADIGNVGFRRMLAFFVVLACGVFSTGVHAGAASFSVTNQDAGAYFIDGQANAPLQLTRGEIYTFNINTGGHPFLIKTVQGNGDGNEFNAGVIGNGTEVGVLTFSVPFNAPDTLFYNCRFHSLMTGTIAVIDGDLDRIFGDGFE
ncbi:MAG: cupredoxin domain-containing protein [Pseudomarimonas sp.]